jgi:hypothetical protein
VPADEKKSARQQIGNFGYVNGTSAFRKSIRDNAADRRFHFRQLHDAIWSMGHDDSANWNIEYHTMTAPDGTMHMGTSQQIGNFVYMNIR